MQKQNYIHPITQIEIYTCLERVMGIGDPSPGTSTGGGDGGDLPFDGAPARVIYM